MNHESVNYDCAYAGWASPCSLHAQAGLAQRHREQLQRDSINYNPPVYLPPAQRVKNKTRYRERREESSSNGTFGQWVLAILAFLFLCGIFGGDAKQTAEITAATPQGEATARSERAAAEITEPSPSLQPAPAPEEPVAEQEAVIEAKPVHDNGADAVAAVVEPVN